MATAPSFLSMAAIPALLNKAQHGFIKTEDQQIAGPAAAFSVEVTNTGTRDADDVVLGFLTPPGSGQDGVPLKTLFGFDRVHVKAGETVTVWLYPEMSDLTTVDAMGLRVANPGEYTLSVGIPEVAEHSMGFVEHIFTAQ